MRSYCKRLCITEAEVWDAYDDWRSHDSGRKNKWRVEAEYGSAASLVSEIAREVNSRSLSFRPLHRYVKPESGNGKRRELTVESVKQQVCDYVAVRAIQPMLDDKLGFWQLGGCHVRGVDDLQRAVKRWQHSTRYWIHGDIRHAYGSTSTWMVMSLLCRYVKSDDVLYLFWSLLRVHGDFLTLGSYLSLRLFQWVLSFAYHHIDGIHRTRRGRGVKSVSHQCWWADDFWLMGRDKRALKSAMRDAERYLASFGLSVHRWKVCRVGGSEPMDVAGRIVRPQRVTLRDSSFLRAFRALRRYRRKPSLRHARSLASHKGQWLHTDCRGFVERHDARGALASACRYISRQEAA